MERKTAQVTIESVTGGKQHKATIPIEVPVNRLLPLLIQKLGLPSHNDTGRRISYRLLHRESGRQLLDSETFEAAGVAEGHRLKILAEVVAGLNATKTLLVYYLDLYGR